MFSVRTAALAALVAGTALCAGLAHAQVFRIVGPDGKVTFSDRPPPDTKATPAQSVTIGAGNSSPSASLPGELRRVAGQYPVHLYTTNGCGPCESGRSYLRQRGIPYTEHTVTTREDFAALQRLSGASNLPFMTLGAQHVPGFSEAEWTQYFDAAGYPKTSQLPPSYRNAEPQPLVAVQRATPPARTPQAPRPQSADAAPPAPGPSSENPTGIRF